MAPSLISDQWNLMTIESLFDRGEMADWQKFGIALSSSLSIAESTLTIAEHHEDRGSAALALILIKRFHPQLADNHKKVDRG